MKKKHLAYAGIAGAVILVLMFIAILSTGTFSIFPSATIDPVPAHTTGDLVVITGKTTFPAGTRLSLDIVDPSPGGKRGNIGATDAYIVRSGGMMNTWSGALDTAGIPPGEYRINAYWWDESKVPAYVRSSLLATSPMRLINSTTDSGIRITPLMNHTLAFIHIDRQNSIKRGEKVLVTGTTNLPVDTQLRFLIIQQSNKSVFTIDPKTQKQDLKGGFSRSGLIDPVPGENGVSRWSFAIDSTEFIPDNYEVIVTEADTRPEDIGREGTFGVESLDILEADADLTTSAVQDTGPCQSIGIDSLPPVIPREKYTITGTTSLQPGTDLVFTIIPAEYDLSINQDRSSPGSLMTGAMGSISVARGTGDTNTWSADVDLSSFPQKEYIMNVSNDRPDLPGTYRMIAGDRYCAKRFTLSGGSS